MQTKKKLKPNKTEIKTTMLKHCQEVVTVSTRAGYDEELAYMLLKCCHQYRKLLSRQGSSNYFFCCLLFLNSFSIIFESFELFSMSKHVFFLCEL